MTETCWAGTWHLPWIYKEEDVLLKRLVQKTVGRQCALQGWGEQLTLAVTGAGPQDRAGLRKTGGCKETLRLQPNPDTPARTGLPGPPHHLLPQGMYTLTDTVLQFQSHMKCTKGPVKVHTGWRLERSCAYTQKH